jgi:hypothetical protein
MMLSLILIALSQQAPGLSEPVSVQDAVVSPRPLASQRRLVRSFDFESAGLQGRVPAAWGRLVNRPGYPKFGKVGIDGEHAAGGQYALRFDVDGGSIAVAIRTGEILIFPQSRYELTARVRTSGLSNASARLAVTLYDDAGHPIPNTERLSEPIRTGGDWVTVSVQPPMDVADARDLVFEMRVEQPGTGPSDMPRHVDVSGAAWFDDVEVWQLPRIEFAAEPATGVTRAPEVPRLKASLRDLVEGRTTTTIRVRDIDGSIMLEDQSVVAGGRSDFVMELDQLGPGWYLGEFEVHDGDRLVAQARQPLSILPARHDTGFTPPVPAFGISLAPEAEIRSTRREELLAQLGPDYVVLPVWQGGRTSQLDPILQEQMDRVLDATLAARIEPVFELAGVPSDLGRQEHLDSDQLIALIENASSHWQPALAPWMLNFGDEVSRWRVRAGETGVFSRHDELVEDFFLFAEDYVATPVIEFHGGAIADQWQSTEDGRDAVVRNIPWKLTTEALQDQLASAARGEVILQFDLAGTSATSARTRAEELSRRLVEGWAAGASMLEVTPPWGRLDATSGIEGTGLLGLDATGFAFEQVAGWLSGRQPEAQVSLGRGIKAVLAGGSGPPFIVAWAEEPTTFGLQIGLGLGSDVLVVDDLLGGSREIGPEERSEPLSIGGAPIIIRGIDVELARFRANASIHPRVIEASTGTHDLEIELFNPWSESIDLRVRPKGPASWSFQPRSRQVAIEPGARVRVPFEFTYPRVQVDGDVDLWFETEFTDALREDVLLLLPSAIESERIQLETAWREKHDESGRVIGVVVTVRAYNIGNDPLRLEAFAFARGFPPMRKWMPELEPGESATRTFLFRNGHEILDGDELLVGVNEFDDGSRLARRVRITSLPGSLVGVDPSGDP